MDFKVTQTLITIQVFLLLALHVGQVIETHYQFVSSKNKATNSLIGLLYIIHV